jgi:hypothetical protein
MGEMTRESARYYPRSSSKTKLKGITVHPIVPLGISVSFTSNAQMGKTCIPDLRLSFRSSPVLMPNGFLVTGDVSRMLSLGSRAALKKYFSGGNPGFLITLSGS